MHDRDYVVTLQGEEIFRTRIEKKALAQYNELRREMGAQFPALDLSAEKKAELLQKYMGDALVSLAEIDTRRKRLNLDQREPLANFFLAYLCTIRKVERGWVGAACLQKSAAHKKESKEIALLSLSLLDLCYFAPTLRREIQVALNGEPA